MTTRRFNLKPGNPIAACPKCGQNTQFNAKSQQVCEDGCEVWIKCICGYAPKDGQMDSVMGGCDEDNIRMALGCWDDAIEAERAAGVARKPSEHSGARSHTDWVGDDARRSDRNVVVGVVNVPELMAPDFAIVRLRNGVCLLVGDEGVNVCNTEADMKAGIVSDGLTFQRHSDLSSATRETKL